MKPMKFKKISDEDNILGFDEIIIFDKQLEQVFRDDKLVDPFSERILEGDVYWYTFLCIADGSFIRLMEEEWVTLEECYQYIGETL